MRTNTRSRWTTFAGLTIAGIALGLSLSGAAAAQTQEPAKPTPEVEQLKQRLQQLEQTVSDLKGQINAIEETKKKPTAPAIVEARYSVPPAAESPEPPPPAKPQDNNGKGESTFSVYSFAMLDAGYQFKQNHPDWFDVIRPTKLPSFEDEFAPDGKTYYGVRQSRLGVKATTPTKYGELKAMFEFGRETFWMASSLTIFGSSFRLSTTLTRPSLSDSGEDDRT